MAAMQEPNSGIYYGWDLEESGWNQQMDANLLKLGRTCPNLIVADRDLSAPPGAAAGDTYIVGASATGAWAGFDGYVAVWDEVQTAWELYQPRIGWMAYLVDEEKITAYKAAGWSAGVAI